MDWVRYEVVLRSTAGTARRNLVTTMLWYMLSRSMSFLAMALGFWNGGRLQAHGACAAHQLYTVFVAVLFAAEAAAALFLYTASRMHARRGSVREVPRARCGQNERHFEELAGPEAGVAGAGHTQDADDAVGACRAPPHDSRPVAAHCLSRVGPGQHGARPGRQRRTWRGLGFAVRFGIHSSKQRRRTTTKKTRRGAHLCLFVVFLYFFRPWLWAKETPGCIYILVFFSSAVNGKSSLVTRFV